MLDTGCLMLDKEKTFLIPFPLKTGFPLRYNKYPETSIQHHVLSDVNCPQFIKLGSKFAILLYIDG
jgi:hypothetical protein